LYAKSGSTAEDHGNVDRFPELRVRQIHAAEAEPRTTVDILDDRALDMAQKTQKWLWHPSP
jgi:hypothetical protein